VPIVGKVVGYLGRRLRSQPGFDDAAIAQPALLYSQLQPYEVEHSGLRQSGALPIFV
jgi:hypothetical protein